MGVRLTVSCELDAPIQLTADCESGTREVRSLDDMQRLLSEFEPQLTVEQCHGLGLVTGAIAIRELAPKYGVDQIARVLDSLYFPTGSASRGRAFSSGEGEATFYLRRADDPGRAVTDLLEGARRDFGEPGEERQLGRAPRPAPTAGH